MTEDEKQVENWQEAIRNLEEAAQRNPGGVAARYLAKGHPEDRFPEKAFDNAWKARIFPKKIISARERLSARKADEENLKILERW